jgi:hypothetical protein
MPAYRIAAVDDGCLSASASTFPDNGSPDTTTPLHYKQAAKNTSSEIVETPIGWERGRILAGHVGLLRRLCVLGRGWRLPRLLRPIATCLLYLAIAVPASAQIVRGDLLRLNTGPCAVSSVAGAPSGGNDCDVAIKTDGTLWVKTGGAWVQVISGAWAGSTNITTLGTITTGIWNAGAVTSSGDLRFSGTLYNDVDGVIVSNAYNDGNDWHRRTVGYASFVGPALAYDSWSIGIADTGAADSAISWVWPVTFGLTGAATFASTISGGAITASTVATTAWSTTSYNGANFLGAKSNAAGTAQFASLTLQASGNSAAMNGVAQIGAVQTAGDVYSTDLSIVLRKADSSYAEAMRLTSTGAATFASTLDVQGISIHTLDESWVGPSSTTGVYFKSGNVSIGIATDNGAGVLQTHGNIVPAHASEFGLGTPAVPWASLDTDSMHVKLFTADLEQVFNGVLGVYKSSVPLAATFTCPTAGSGHEHLAVTTFPSAPTGHVFADGDSVVVQNYTRSGGITLDTCVGTVTSDGAVSGTTDTYTFTRPAGAAGGTMTATVTVAVGNLAMDYGVTTQGFVEVSASNSSSGATLNTPSIKARTWATSPVAANFSTVSLMGNCNGEYGYSGGSVYCFAAGVYANDNSFVTIDPTNGVRMFKRASSADTEMFHLAADGSGHLATNAISWTTAGVATIAGFIINATELYAGTGATRVQMTAAGGFHAGATAFADAPFSVTAAGALVASSATITGSVTATSGAIGGWHVDATSLHAADDTVGLSSAVTGGDDIRFWAGHATPASAPFLVTEAGSLTASSGTVGGWTLAATYLKYDGAADANSSGMATADYPFYAGKKYADRATAPFRVTPAGALTSTSATITGTINATAGYFGTGSTKVAINADGLDVGNAGRILGGMTGYNTGTGFWLGYSGAYKLSVGHDSGNRLTWDGTDLVVVSSTVSIGSTGVTLTSGTTPEAGRAYKWNATGDPGLYFYDGGGAEYPTLSLTPGDDGAINFNTGTGHGMYLLLDALTPFGTMYIGTAASPMSRVYASTYYVGTTVGADCTSAADVTVEKGIVVGCNAPAPSPALVALQQRVTDLEATVSRLLAALESRR